MLDVMRSNAKSSLIAVIFGAIIITFVFSFGRGSSGFRTRTPETWAARVNGDLVTASDFVQAYSNRFRQQAQMRGGKYNFDYYKRLVENGYGMSVPRFEEAWRRDMLRAKVVQAILAGANVSDDEVKAYWQAQHESAAINYVRFNAFMFREKVTATDAEA